MSNLNKIITLLSLLVFRQLSNAGEAILFDQNNLFAFSDKGVISGFYDAENDKFSCYFLFSQQPDDKHPPPKVDTYSATRLQTFIPGDDSLYFENRLKDYDIEGTLYRDGDEWVIRTSRPQAGCANAMGIFEFDPSDIRAETYAVSKRIPAIGIRLVNSKTSFYDLRGGQFFARKGYLTKGDGVIVFKEFRGYSYVRYVNPNSSQEGRVTTGWVHSADLANPFPPARER
ncbi:hypothetical protein [Paraburkholderia terrae]|uniref:hypothetical protein n=1 Tax=Paraburkholderia terrae TaxID=311230 RepID=UPI0033655EBA